MSEIPRGENGGSESQVSPRRKPQATLIVDGREVVVGLISEKSLPSSFDVFEQRRLPNGLIVINMSHLAPTVNEVANRQLTLAREVRLKEEASQSQTPVDPSVRRKRDLFIGATIVATEVALGGSIIYAASSLMDK